MLYAQIIYVCGLYYHPITSQGVPPSPRPGEMRVSDYLLLPPPPPMLYELQQYSQISILSLIKTPKKVWANLFTIVMAFAQNKVSAIHVNYTVYKHNKCKHIIYGLKILIKLMFSCHIRSVLISKVQKITWRLIHNNNLSNLGAHLPFSYVYLRYMLGIFNNITIFSTNVNVSYRVKKEERQTKNN